MKLNEYRERIPLKEMAEFLGYESISGPMATNLTYILGNRSNPEDEIVIFPAKNTYFSRKGKFDDKGNLINFVQNRLHFFPSCTQTGLPAVHEILDQYLNNKQNVTHSSHQTSSFTHNTKQNITFDLNYWNPQPIIKDNPYLIKLRKLSPKTVEDFSSRLLIYTAGKNNHIAFPFRKPGQMEIVNFEMRNYFPETNTNYKGFCVGGDKSQSCWIASFVPFDKVTDVYVFESAIDAMSFYEIKHFNKEMTCALVSTGGNVTNKQIESLMRVFPSASIEGSHKVNWHTCYDNDASGNCFDVATAFYLKGEECKAYTRTNPGDNYKTVYLSFPNGETFSWKEGDFSSKSFLQSHHIDSIDVIKPPKYKDWNELLGYYKKFDANLGPGMKFLPAIENITKQLDLRGYHQLTEVLNNSGKDIIERFLHNTTYPLHAPLAETNVYSIMVDCNLFMGFDTLVPVPTNLQIIDKTTQRVLPAHTMNEFFKNEGINIFKDLTSNDFKTILENKPLTITKGGIEKRFERDVLPSGWSLKAAPIKNKNIDLDKSI